MPPRKFERSIIIPTLATNTGTYSTAATANPSYATDTSISTDSTMLATPTSALWNTMPKTRNIIFQVIESAPNNTPTSATKSDIYTFTNSTLETVTASHKQ